MPWLADHRSSSMTGVSLCILGAILNVTHIDGCQRLISDPVYGVGIVYPGERVDFSLAWPESRHKSQSNMTIRLDKECVFSSTKLVTRDQVAELLNQNVQEISKSQIWPYRRVRASQ